MKSELKKIKIRNHEISYVEINNNKKNTLLVVHGLNSSLEFANNLFHKVKNFNLVAITLPLNKFNALNDLNIEMGELVNVVKEIISKINTKVYVLGHSLAGGIVSEITRAKKIFYLSTINPGLIKQKDYIKYKNIIIPTNTKQAITKKAIEKFGANLIKYKNKNHSTFIKVMLADESSYRNVIENNLLNQEYMTETLKENYLNNKKKSVYIIGSNDNVVSTSEYVKFVNSIGEKVNIIKNSGHNPIKDNVEDVLKILNHNIPNKKYIFKKKVNIFKN